MSKTEIKILRYFIEHSSEKELAGNLLQFIEEHERYLDQEAWIYALTHSTGSYYRKDEGK